jgi:hypothetical protein
MVGHQRLPDQLRTKYKYTCSMDPDTVGTTGGRIIPGSGSSIRFDVLHSFETRSLEALSQRMEKPKVISRESRRVRWLIDDTTSDVWLGELSLCRNHSPCLPVVEPLPLQNLHVEMTSNTLPRRYGHMVQLTVDVK